MLQIDNTHFWMNVFGVIKKQFLTNYIIFSTLKNICLEMKFVDLW